MAVVTASPSTYYNFFKTTLKRSMTSADQTTGIVLDRILGNDGVALTLDSVSMILTFIKGDKRELISAGGFTQDADGNFTLTDVTRDLPWDASSFTGQGNPVKFTAKATVFVSFTGQVLSDIAFKSVANTFAEITTFSEAPVLSKGAKFTAFADTTARDAYFTSPANGDQCFVTGTGMQYYDGGWSTYGTATVFNAAEGTKGLVDIATGTEIGAGTATDPTSGAINVVPVSQTTKTSNGASDENKVPVLNADGALHINHIATGTPDGTKFVKDDGTLAVPSQNIAALSANTTTATVGTSTSEVAFTGTGFAPSIGAGTLSVGDLVTLRVAGLCRTTSGQSNTFRIKLAGTTISTITIATTNATWSANLSLLVTSIGGSGTVQVSTVTGESANLTATPTSSATIDTTASNAFSITAQSSYTTGGVNQELYMVHLSKLNAA